MQLKCGYCKKVFTATHGQAKRSRQPSTQPKVGFTCSAFCVAMIGVASRNVTQRLSPRKLAYSRLNNAVESGKIVRPTHCQKCGGDPGVDCLGRSRIEGHHPDHSKALDVIWLCDGCHKAETPRVRGACHHNARLTAKKVIAIRKAFAAGKTLRALGAKYGVTHGTISHIVLYKHWRHIQ